MTNFISSEGHFGIQKVQGQALIGTVYFLRFDEVGNTVKCWKHAGKTRAESVRDPT